MELLHCIHLPAAPHGAHGGGQGLQDNGQPVNRGDACMFEPGRCYLPTSSADHSRPSSLSTGDELEIKQKVFFNTKN